MAWYWKLYGQDCDSRFFKLKHFDFLNYYAGKTIGLFT